MKVASEEQTRIVYAWIVRFVDEPDFEKNKLAVIGSSLLTWSFLTSVRAYGELSKHHRGLTTILSNGDLLVLRCLEAKTSGWKDPNSTKNKWVFPADSFVAKLFSAYLRMTEDIEDNFLFKSFQVCVFRLWGDGLFVFLLAQFQDQIVVFKRGSITRHMGGKSIYYVEECARAPSHHSMNEYRFGGIRWETEVLGVESQRERQAHASIMQTLVYVNREDEERKKDADNLLRLTADALKSLCFFFETPSVLLSHFALRNRFNRTRNSKIGWSESRCFCGRGDERFVFSKWLSKCFSIFFVSEIDTHENIGRGEQIARRNATKKYFKNFTAVHDRDGAFRFSLSSLSFLSTNLDVVCGTTESSDYMNEEVWVSMMENWSFVTGSHDDSLRFMFLVYSKIMSNVTGDQSVSITDMKIIYKKELGGLDFEELQEELKKTEADYLHLLRNEYNNVFQMVLDLGVNVDLIGILQEWRVCVFFKLRINELSCEFS